MSNIVVAGHLCADLTPALPGSVDLQPGLLIEAGPLRISSGGSVANTGRALVRLGHEVRAVAPLGDDFLASVVETDLETAGMDTSGIQRVEALSSSYSVVLDNLSGRVLLHHVGSAAAFDGAAIDLAGAALLHVGYPSLLPQLMKDGSLLPGLFDQAVRSGVVTSLDLAVVDPASSAAAVDWRQFFSGLMPSVDLVSPSVDDVGSVIELTGSTRQRMDAAADLLLESGAAVVLVSGGSSGMLVAAAGHARLASSNLADHIRVRDWVDARCWLAAPGGPVKTTNGAGDAATAGFVSAVLAGGDPRWALTESTAAAQVRLQGLE